MGERSALYWQVYERLTQDDELEPRSRALVEAAFDGPAAVREALQTSAEPEGGPPMPSGGAGRPARAFLRSVKIEGFRGIGRTATLDLPPGPGLNLVVGRNGSGKSSIAEGLEVLLTGESLRWANRRQKDWIGGFRNLHQPDPTAVEAELDLDGASESVRMRRGWKPGEDVAGGTLKIHATKRGDLSLESLGWKDALTTFRPILSYNELGKALDEGPSHLFDLLRGVLGMDEMTAAEQAIVEVRKATEPAVKKAKTGKEPLLQKLEALQTDDRAQTALELMKKRNLDLVKLLDVVGGAAEDEGRVRGLRGLASLRPPSEETVLDAARELREASAEHRRLKDAAAGLQFTTSELLEKALHWHEREPSPTCPVCESEGVLDQAWRDRAAARLTELKQSSDAVRSAATREKNALATAQRLVRGLTLPADQGVTGYDAARLAYERWSMAPEDPNELASHLETVCDDVATTWSALAAAAGAELQRTQAEWAPVQRELVRWIDDAEAAEVAAEQVKWLKAAEVWVKKADQDLRAERFAPIRQRSQEIWEALRHQSNVAIKDIRLEGTATKRRVELEVVVDGADAVALGVMSQGELHAMLLALFLPRLTLDESPFGFLVIDDPVQAMDPAKVDGLARVLADVAKTRQVVVLTHDARLPEAVRRLQLPATVFEVTRKEKSVVELRKTRDPASQLLADAKAVAYERDKLGPTLTGRVVPGLCRSAIEARLKEIAWQRFLKEGMPHAEIEAAIEAVHGVHDLATLALLGDPKKGADLLAKLNKTCGKQETDTFMDLKAYAHQKYTGNALELVERSERLLRSLA